MRYYSYCPLNCQILDKLFERVNLTGMNESYWKKLCFKFSGYFWPLSKDATWIGCVIMYWNFRLCLAAIREAW